MPKGVFRSESESYARLGGNAVQELAKNGGQAPRRSVHQHAALKMADADSAEDEQKPSKAESWAAATSAEAAEGGASSLLERRKSRLELVAQRKSTAQPPAQPPGPPPAKPIRRGVSIVEPRKSVVDGEEEGPTPTTEPSASEQPPASQLPKRGSTTVESAPSEPNMARRRSQKNPKSAKELAEEALQSPVAGAQSSGLVGSVDDGGHMPAFGPSLTSRESGSMAPPLPPALGEEPQPSQPSSSDAQPSAKTQEPHKEPAEHDETQDEVLDDKKPEAKEPAVTEGKEIDIPPEEPAVPEVKAKEPAVPEVKVKPPRKSWFGRS